MIVPTLPLLVAVLWLGRPAVLHAADSGVDPAVADSARAAADTAAVAVPDSSAVRGADSVAVPVPVLPGVRVDRERPIAARRRSPTGFVSDDQNSTRKARRSGQNRSLK